MNPRPISKRTACLTAPGNTASGLQPIGEKLMAYALASPYRLTTEDERHLWSRYIHLSAHWTPSKGLLLNACASGASQ